MFWDFLVKNLPSNPVIVEAGCHDGEDALARARIWPQAKIHIFEPNPHWHPIIKERISSFQNISFYPMALGDKVGYADFYQCLTNKSGSDSTLLPVRNDVFWTETVPSNFSEEPMKVPMTTLDAWAKKCHVDKIDFLELDMQGAEGIALQSSPEMLKKTSFIQTEYNERSVYEGTMLFDDMKEFLRIKGFVVIGLWKANQEDFQGNALFAKVGN